MNALERDLVPLAPRLGTLSMLRVVLAVLAVAAAAYAPETVGAVPNALAPLVAAYLVGAAGVELVRQLAGRLPVPVVGIGLLGDGVFFALVLLETGGPLSVLAPLVSVHVVAVTLLASYRTGLKLALWHSLLAVVAYNAVRAGLLTGAQAPLRDSVFAITSAWIFAIATAAFSALNERELKRSRSGLRALSLLARDLEHAASPDHVARILCGAARAATGAPRAAVVLTGTAAPSIVVADGEKVDVAPLEGPQPLNVLRVVGRGSPELIRTLNESDGAVAAALPGARNLAVVPLLGDPALGVLVVERAGRRGSTLPRSTLATLEQFAAHAVLSYRKAELLEEVGRLAVTDALTGLANRRAFADGLAREVRRAGRNGAPLSLVLLDVDHFKRVNDTYGHPKGDDVLRHVGRVLARRGRGGDLVARYGGEEFAVLLPDCDGERAFAVAERLRSDIAGEGSPLPITASAGAATLGLDADDAEGLIAATDSALYAAKGSGRDRTVRATRQAALTA